MHALRRITYAKPIHTHTIHYQINRKFSDPKAIHELSRRHLVNVRNSQLLSKGSNPLPASTQSSTSTSTVNNTKNRINIKEEQEEEEEEDNEDDDEYDEECPLSNPYYSRLLESKLDSCPQQPFNETTNIVWSALYHDVINRNNRIERMSRWEQIQRGYVKHDNNTTHSYSYHTKSTSTSTATSTTTSSTLSAKLSSSTRNEWVNTIIDVNDILQPHYSLDDCVRNEKENTATVTLGKATGSLNEILDNKDIENSEIIEMRNDLKWKVRKMKKHIKKKRRDNLRMKKTTMRQRNQQ